MPQTAIVIAICLMLLSLAIWQEVRRPAKSRLWLRLAALVISVAAFACLILPVSYTAIVSRSVEHEAVLLTEGYNADSLSAYPHTRVYTLEKGIHQAYPKTVWLSDAGSLNSIQPQITTLHILGYGLTTSQLSRLGSLHVTFHAQTPAGFTAVNHTAQVIAGQSFQVQGKYQNTSNQTIRLVLEGLGTHLDSVTLPPHAQTPFQLSTAPKHTGRAVYHLLALAGKDTLAHEPLPLSIAPTKPIKVLVLAATPDFENKFLKNWLAANGYASAVRTGISKGKTSQEFSGMDKLPLDNLSAAAFSKFDVVTADLAAIKALSPAEGAALYQQVNQQGMGLVIRADSAFKAAGWLQGSFTVSTTPVQKAVTAKLMISGAAGRTSALSINPAYLNNRSNTQPLITDQQNHILASTLLAGAGKVVFTTLTPTFSWALAGNTKDYAAVWTALLSKAARRQPAADNWLVSSSLPVNGSPVKVTLQTGAVPLGIRINQTVAAPEQDALLPFAWTAAYWPLTGGWQQAVQAHSSYRWYAYAKNDWKSLQAAEKVKVTADFAARYVGNRAVTKQIQQKVRIEVPKIYFYILLLLACAYLWAESRWLS